MAGATLARVELGSLEGRTVLIVGAGKMSDLAAGALTAERAHVLIANRTATRAAAVAARTGGIAVPMTELAGAIADADLVLTSTGSSDPVITREMVATAMQGRTDRPLVLLDLAVPRDVEHSAGDIEGVRLKDMDDLREAVAPDRDQIEEIERVRAIVADEAPRFAMWQRTHLLAPLLSALQQRAETVRSAEVRRATTILAQLSERERAAIETLTRSIVAKLLHDPMKAVKSLAGTSEGEALARALRMLYALPDEEG
jgi:glutamyl-tRNA reductase